jgi:NAD+ kinase
MGGRKVLILANLMKDDASGVAHEIQGHLATLGVASEVFAFAGAVPQNPSTKGVDLVISLGGDGTVLYSARLAAAAGVPIMPFNLGRLGFIAAFGRNDWVVALDCWLEGRLGLTARSMLSIHIRREGRSVSSFLALNDGVVSAQGIAKVICLDITAGGSPMGSYRSDGVIIATPTGSTAYNLAAGGPVLHPEMDAMILNPICPFTLSNRPLVVPGSERIEVLVEEGKRTGVMLTVDGQETFMLQAGDKITFTHADRKALIYMPERLGFYEVLREKLNWSGGPNA